MKSLQKASVKWQNKTIKEEMQNKKNCQIYERNIQKF